MLIFLSVFWSASYIGTIQFVKTLISFQVSQVSGQEANVFSEYF